MFKIDKVEQKQYSTTDHVQEANDSVPNIEQSTNIEILNDLNNQHKKHQSISSTDALQLVNDVYNTSPRNTQQLNMTHTNDNKSSLINKDGSDYQRNFDSQGYRYKYITKFLNQLKIKAELIEYNIHCVVDTTNTDACMSPLSGNKRLRSQLKYIDDDEIKKNNSSPTYAAITQKSILNLINIFINYGMNEDDVFCDIGSGMGGVVFTTAIVYNIRSLGIEISKVRCDFSQEFKKQQLKSIEVNDNHNDIQERLNKVEFLRANAGIQQQLQLSDNTPVTCIYSFNVLMSQEDSQGIVDVINKSSHIKIIVWSLNENKTINQFGLRGFIYKDKFYVSTQCAREKHTMYVYIRVKQTELTQQHETSTTNSNVISKPLLQTQQLTEIVNFNNNDTSINLNMENELDKYVSVRTMQNIQQQILQQSEKRSRVYNNVIKIKSDEQYEVLSHITKLLHLSFKEKRTLCIDDFIRHTLKPSSIQLGQFLFNDTKKVKQYLKDIEDATQFIQIFNAKNAGQYMRIKEQQQLSDINDKLKLYCKSIHSQSVQYKEQKYKLDTFADTQQQLRRVVQTLLHTEVHAQHACRILESIVSDYRQSKNYNNTHLTQNIIQNTKVVLENDTMYNKLDDSNKDRFKHAAELYLNQCEYVKNKDKLVLELKQNNDYLQQVNNNLQSEYESALKFYAQQVHKLTFIQQIHNNHRFTHVYISQRVNDSSSKVDDQVITTEADIKCIAKLFMRGGDIGIKEMQCILQLFQTEIAKSPYTTKVINQLEILNKPTLVFPYYQYNLVEYLQQHNPSVSCRNLLIRYIIKCIDDAHHHNVSHNNLKPENIMISSDGVVVITDWCLKRSYYEVGVQTYQCPEDYDVHQNEDIEYLQRRDYWSVGTVAYYIMRQVMPYTVKQLTQYKDMDVALPIPEGFKWLTGNTKNVISSMLVVDPLKRMTTSYALHLCDQLSQKTKSFEELQHELTLSLNVR